MKNTIMPLKGEKLIQTHKHLTLVFTGVVFVIVMIIGSAFLGLKYISEQRLERQQFLKQVRDIQLLVNTQENILESFQRLEKFSENKKFGEKFPSKKQAGRLADINFIVVDTQNNILIQNILQAPRFDSLDFSHELMYVDEQTNIAIRDLGSDSKIIFYQQLRYDISDLLRDLLILSVLAGISGILFYVIGYSFVKRALLPVEENMQDMSDFIHNAGHELKTPLAVMRGNLQVMQAE
jgi:signal transduction histidine kinase